MEGGVRGSPAATHGRHWLRCVPSFFPNSFFFSFFFYFAVLMCTQIVSALSMKRCYVGSGRFLIWLAKNSGERRNYLGLEIRQKVSVVPRFTLNEF